MMSALNKAWAVMMVSLLAMPYVGRSQGADLNRDVVLRNYGATMFFKPPPNDIIGSPYLFDVWFGGSILLLGDTTPYPAAFLYDAANDIMLFTEGTDTFSVTQPTAVERISFANLEFVYAMDIERSGQEDFIRGGWYQLLAGDSLRLLMKNSKSVDENRSVSNYMGGGGDGRRRYILSKTLYAQRPGEKVTRLKRSRNGLMELMGDRQAEIDAFMGERDINPQSTLDLVSLFRYYNTLDSTYALQADLDRERERDFLRSALAPEQEDRQALTSGPTADLNRDVVLRNYGATMFFKPVSDEIVGSPYLHDVWLSGRMILRNDTASLEVAFMYDAANDMMLFTDGNDTMSVAHPLMIDRINYADMDFIYALSVGRSGGKDVLEGGYYQVLSGDSLLLLMKYRKSVDENRSVSNYMGGGGDGRRRYILSKTLYVQAAGGSIMKLRPKEAWILDLMDDRRPEVIAYIDENDINLKNTAELQQVFDYYNLLRSSE